MRNDKTIAGKVVTSYLKKFPDSPTLTLAKKIYKENPVLFKDLETCRGMIRYNRGQRGKRNRELIKDKSMFKEAGSKNPFNLPESSTKVREVWRLPKDRKKVLLLSDIHFPYQDNLALTTALNYGKQEEIDTIFLMGDIMDFYQLSFHEKDPRETDISLELEMCRNFFDSLKINFPNVSIYYIPGNHEYRLQRYLRVKAPELLDCTEFKLDSLLKLGEKGIHYLEHGTKCYVGKLLLEHGDKMRGSGGVNPARSLFAKLKRHAICGHFHRTSEATEKVYDGDVFVTYSIGCLCELEPRYMEVNNHNHGFAIIEVFDNDFCVSNKKIVNGKVY